MSDRTWRVPGTLPRVIDGDTIQIFLQLGWRVSIQEIVRLYGVNCPETRGKNASPAGIVASEFTRDWIGSAKTLEVESLKFEARKDIYGRTLARVFRDDDPMSLNEALLQSGNAVEFMT